MAMRSSALRRPTESSVSSTSDSSCAVSQVTLKPMLGERRWISHSESRWNTQNTASVSVSTPWAAASPRAAYYAALVFLAAATAVMLLVRRSRQGLILRAVEGSEMTARASGIDVAKHKRRAFAIAALLAGAAGAAYAFHVGRATAADFSLELSFQAATFAAVGGRGSILGPIASALCLHVLLQALDVPPGTRILFYALALMLILRFFPGGIAGELRRLKSSRERKR